MDWEIVPFVGMGPIKFGMNPSEVAAIMGKPRSSRVRDTRLRESRDIDVPIVSYVDNAVSEVEAFYDVLNVTFRGRNVFTLPGRQVLAFLEAENGGAKEDVGVVLFENIGMTAGRLDQAVREDHSVTAFRKGLWDDGIDEFKTITFL